LVPLLLMVAIAGAAYAQSPGDYNYFFQTSVTNTTGGEICNVAVRAPVNAGNLIDGGFLATTGADVLTVLQSSNATRDITAQLDGNPSSWWYPVLGCLPNNGSTSCLTYMGGSTADTAQSLWLQASDSIDIPDADSLDITSNLIVESLGVRLAELPGGEACLPCK